MITKDPVRLDSSVVEIEGEALDFEWLTFWSDTFRHTDLLQYQTNDVQMMFTTNPETTTYEFEVEMNTVPPTIDHCWESGDRFSLVVENHYFDLDVDTAWVADLDGGVATIVAKVRRRGLAHLH